MDMYVIFKSGIYPKATQRATFVLMEWYDLRALENGDHIDKIHMKIVCVCTIRMYI